MPRPHLRYGGLAVLGLALGLTPGCDFDAGAAIDTGQIPANPPGSEQPEPPDDGPDTPLKDCGNGSRDPGSESCDDGNVAGGDGCSASCTIEPGYLCDDGGASCTRVTHLTVREPYEERGVRGEGWEETESCDDGILAGFTARGFGGLDGFSGIRGHCAVLNLGDSGAVSRTIIEDTGVAGVIMGPSSPSLCSPSDRILVGARISFDDFFLTGIQPLCAEARVTGGELVIGDPVAASLIGDAGPETEEVLCGSGRAVAPGFGVDDMGAISGFFFECGELYAVTEDGSADGDQ